MASLNMLIPMEWTLVATGPQFGVKIQPLKDREIEVWCGVSEPDEAARGVIVPSGAIYQANVRDGEFLYARAMRLATDIHVVFEQSNSYDEYGNLEVAIQDQFTEIVDLYLQRLIDIITIDVNTAIGDTTIVVSTTGTIPSIGNYVCLKEDMAFYQGRIQAVTPISGNQYSLSLNSPLDFAFTTDGGCSISSVDMNVDGSVTPVVFAVSPALLNQDIFWDICRMLLVINDDAAMDDGKFGGIVGGLANGLVFRVRYNGHVKNLFTIRTNGDFRLRSFDAQYLDATLGPDGQYGFGVRRSFNGMDKNGVVIRLRNDSEPDSFEVLVQDDLTSLGNMRMVIQGHVGLA